MTDTRTPDTDRWPEPPPNAVDPSLHPAQPPDEDEAAERRKGYIRLAVILFLGTAASVGFGVAKTVAIIGAVILMIMLHELGHYLTAKWAGMKVTEFFLGFGPKIWSIQKGETEYGIKAIPAGGYVKIIGMSNLEQVDPEEEHRTYRQQPYWRRMSVAVAGSTMHMLIAFVLLWVLLGFVGVPTGDVVPKVSTISKLATGESPAEKAGFRVGDEILQLDGRDMDEWEDIRGYIAARPETPITFTVERDGARKELTATPLDLSKVKVEGLEGRETPKEPTGFVGLAPTEETEAVGPVEAVPASVDKLGETIVGSVKSLGAIFSPDGLGAYVKNLSSPQSLSGEDPEARDQPRFTSPVGLVRVAGQAAEEGPIAILTLLILINVFVGIFNMVPLPPLDGGHVAIATYERIRSRKGRRHFVDMTKVLPLTYAVFLVIVLIGVTSIFLDIVRPAENPFQ